MSDSFTRASGDRTHCLALGATQWPLWGDAAGAPSPGMVATVHGAPTRVDGPDPWERGQQQPVAASVRPWSFGKDGKTAPLASDG